MQRYGQVEHGLENKLASYIRIVKLEENDSSALYSFSPDDILTGKVAIDKSTGEVTLVENVVAPSAERMFLSTATRLRKVWREGNLPDVTAFAS